MSRKPSKTSTRNAADMRPEYRFDYRRARPNRFASRMSGDVRAVVLEPDVASFFESSESVNALLRSVIAALPAEARSGSLRRPRRKAG